MEEIQTTTMVVLHKTLMLPVVAVAPDTLVEVLALRKLMNQEAAVAAVAQDRHTRQKTQQASALRLMLILHKKYNCFMAQKKRQQPFPHHQVHMVSRDQQHR
jgi:hypothetical protein